MLASFLSGPTHQGRVLLEGHLSRQGGIFKDWQRRYCELTEDAIICYLSKGGAQLSHFNLTTSTVYTDSTVRHFCFTVSDPNSGDSVCYSCDTSADKEHWKESIITQLSVIQKSLFRRTRKTDRSESEQIRNDYHARPIIYIKVIGARNLTAKDIGGASDPFVEVTVGLSKEKTITRKKTLNPEWGMIFKFDWDPKNRFAKIDVWDEDTLSKNDFLGTTLISLYSLRGHQSWVAWYPLYKRSSKSNISGEVEIEICCEGVPGLDPLVERMYREVTLMPDMYFDMLPLPPSNDDSSSMGWQNILEAKGFPFRFPPAEIEQLEDVSVRVTMTAQTYLGKISSPGILFLTSYRLIFVSRLRLTSYNQIKRNTILQDSDLSCFIPISCICDIAFSSGETDQVYQSQYGESLAVNTIDGRILTFFFNASDSFDFGMGSAGSHLSMKDRSPRDFSSSTMGDMHTRLNGKKSSSGIATRVFGHSVKESSEEDDNTAGNRSGNRLSGLRAPSTDITVADCPADPSPIAASSASEIDNCGDSTLQMIGASSSWDQLCKSSAFLSIDALDSEEGGPGSRLHTRLNLKKVSRHSERLYYLSLPLKLLETLSSACVNQPTSPTSLILSDERVPLGSSVALPAHDAKLSQRELLQLYFTKEAFEARIRNSTLDDRATFFSCLENGWYVFDVLAEMNRLGIPDAHWRITEVNTRYEICPTYPALAVVPAAVDDITLAAAAQFRSKGRFPAFCWRNPHNLCSIVRCSQPLVGISFSRNEQDEYLLSEISKCSGGLTRMSVRGADVLAQASNMGKKNYVIADARPQINAVANQAAGKGVENAAFYENANIIFLNIPNIHAVRKSLEMLDDAVLDEATFSSRVEASGWLVNISKVLKGVMRIVHCVGFEDLSVIVHCSDGWDRTSQLTSLSMLLLDGYYRTLKGFIVLIEKEWLSFGHKFESRCGWGYEGWKDDERSPVFQQFLDCVFQCINQLPNAFEFNEDLLLFILEHLQTGWFGDFMFECEKDKKEFKRSHGGLSMWAIVLHNMHRFTNTNYSPQTGAVLPVVRLSSLVFWTKWFNRWNDRFWRAAWIQQCHVEDSFEETYVPTTPGGANAARIWVDDNAVTACRRCSKNFSFITRRHHCRRCGHIFCEKCAAEARTIVSINAYKSVRVCIDCAHIIDQGIESESIISQYEAALKEKSPSDANFGVSFDTMLTVGERTTASGLVDDWNGEY